MNLNGNLDVLFAAAAMIVAVVRMLIWLLGELLKLRERMAKTSNDSAE